LIYGRSVGGGKGEGAVATSVARFKSVTGGEWRYRRTYISDEQPEVRVPRGQGALRGWDGSGGGLLWWHGDVGSRSPCSRW
jgi:hypothetical protein